MSINIGTGTLRSSGYTYNSEVIDPNIVTNGLVAWYDAGNLSSLSGTGTTYYNCGYGCQYYSSDPGCSACDSQWLDMSGYGNNVGRYAGGTNYYNYNNIGGSVEFPGGNNNFYYCTTSDSLASTDSAVTITGWIYPDSLTTGNIFNLNYNNGWRGRFQTDQKLWFYVSGNFISGGTVTLNQWSHVCFTGDASGLAIYHNNELVASNSTAFSPTSTVQSLLIGAYNATSEIFDGQMACLQIYNRRLTPAEIKQNYDADRPRFDEGNLIPVSPTPTPTITPTMTPTPSKSITPTPTPTPSITRTPSKTPTPTPSPSAPANIYGVIYNNGSEGLNITAVVWGGTTIFSGTLTEGNLTGTLPAPKGSNQTVCVYFNGVPGGTDAVFIELNGSLVDCSYGSGNPTCITGINSSTSSTFYITWENSLCIPPP